MNHVLLDGDIITYRLAFASEEENEAIALSRVASFIETILWEDLNAETYQGFLTGSGNFRNDIAKTLPYKGNREGLQKPKHYSLIREYLEKAWDFKVSQGQEADDDIAIAHVASNYESIIASLDKDFLQLPGKHYNFVKKELKFVTEEEALLNFYIQVLTGDRVDNIEGIKGIGPIKANKILAECYTPRQMFLACCEAYGNEERVIENARLLYLRRVPEELWQPPVD